MGDVRFTAQYERVRDAPDSTAAIRALTDDGVVEALAAASRANDPYLANVLATEASNRMRRSRAIGEHLAEGVVSTDRAGRVTFVNPAAARLLDVPPAGARGRNVLDVLGWTLADGARPAWDESLVRDVLKNGVVVRSDEALFTRTDGQALPVVLTVSPTLRDGELDGVVVLFRDANEERRVPQGDPFDQLHGVVRTIGDTMAEGCVVLDRTGRFLYVNKAAMEVAGVTEEKLLAANAFTDAWDVRQPDGTPLGVDERPVSAAILEGGPLHGREVMFHRADGARIPLLLDVVPVSDVDGRIARVVVVFRNLTQRKQAEAERERLQRDLDARLKELKAAYEELDAFSYSASHDLRAPLRAIEYLGRALVEDHGADLAEDARDYVARIQREARRLTDLVNDLLLLSRVSRHDLHREDVDVSALAREILDRLRERDPERVVDVRVEEGVRARADAGLLRVLLENLLGNAWKYTSQREEARVTFTAEPSGGGRAFVVEDNGIGFDPRAEGARLFQPFHRLSSASAFDGTGIGLAIVKRIVDRHEGAVWADARPGAGATFRFTLGGAAEPAEDAAGAATA